ncbi:MAG TPA: PepSY domain-containing protein [Allosphingosinicella sp.]|nr:PepSY domain-containing protein [Allosphingosinicella sp.]
MARFLLLVCAFGSLAGALPAAAHPPRERDQDIAFRARREGRFMPLRAIEARIVPHMRGYDYLGPELDPGTGHYRLKFMRGPRVVWVDVDARTGEIVARSGF